MFSENLAIYLIILKMCTARQATHGGIMLHGRDVLYMPDSEGKNTGTHSSGLILIAS